MKPYYEQDGVTIYHGDSREIAPFVEADVVLTDPPYGVGLSARTTKHSRREGAYTQFEDSEENIASAVIPLVTGLIERIGRAVITPGNRCMWMYPKPDDIGVIWHPAGAGRTRWGFNCSTPILYYGKDPYLVAGLGGRPNGFSWNNAAENNGHPCPKPIQVMTWMVGRASLDGHAILDPFMGSGTTLIAAKKLGRRAIGIEIEERYCEIAAKRLAQGVFNFG